MDIVHVYIHTGLYCSSWPRVAKIWPVASLCQIGLCPCARAIPTLTLDLFSALYFYLFILLYFILLKKKPTRFHAVSEGEGQAPPVSRYRG